jgi:hypothetical protein
MNQAMGEDAATDGQHGHRESHPEHARGVRHHLVELVGDAERPAEVPGDPGELVRKVCDDRDQHSSAPPTQRAFRRLPRLHKAVAASAAQAEVSRSSVVSERRGSPEQATDEHEDEVHAVPVENVAEAALLAWHAGEGEDEQCRGHGNHCQQRVIGDQQCQHYREYYGERLERPRTLEGHHYCDRCSHEADHSQYWRDDVSRCAF